MKVLAILLVCAFVAVQGRSTAVEPIQSGRTLVSLGEAPWLVHLRVAVSTSGLLKTGAGSLLSERWALTTSKVVEDLRFVWIRYGTVTVINPQLVTESTVANVDPTESFALISINRIVHSTEFISPVSIVPNFELPASTTLYLYGETNGAPGEQLISFEVSLTYENEVITATSEDGKASKFDLGAPLVSDGQQFGILKAAGDDYSAAKFVRLNETAWSWIQEQTGLQLE